MSFQLDWGLFQTIAGNRATQRKTARCILFSAGLVEYDVYVENQMRKTISGLLDKIDVLNQIRNEFDVSFYLEVVPEIYVDDINPCLAPTLDVIDFCHATRTEIDIDLYVYSSEDEEQDNPQINL